MVDARFFTTGQAMTLAEVAAATGAQLADGGAPDRVIQGVAPLALAGPDDVSFLARAAMREAFADARAGACFVSPALSVGLDPARNLLIVADPQAAHAHLARLMHPEPAPAAEVSPTAIVDPTAVLGAHVSLAPGVVIGPRAEIGAGSTIGAGTVIGAGVVIGPGARIASQVTISHALIGARVTILPGARIGQAGFGYLKGPKGLEPVPQLGRVIIGDDVDIGANTTIDRGAGDDTVIGNGTKIDNLVQIAHNCRIGAHCVIVSQVGLSGSVTLGDGVVLAGQVGIADHLSIGAGAQLAAKAGVMRDVPPGATQIGSPARDLRAFFRSVAALDRLARRNRSDQS